MRTLTHARTQVMYTKFTEILDAVFTCKNLEKMPTVQARIHARTQASTHARTHAQSELGAQKVFTVKATTILADSAIPGLQRGLAALACTRTERAGSSEGVHSQGYYYTSRLCNLPGIRAYSVGWPR